MGAGARAGGLSAAAPCPVFARVEAADTAKGADRMAETADAAVLLGLVRRALAAGGGSAAAARRVIAGAVAWCGAHPGGTLGAAVQAGASGGMAEVGAVAPRAVAAGDGAMGHGAAGGGAEVQAAWLLGRACLAPVGQVRDWAARRGVRRLPGWAVAGFAGAGRGAVVFDAGTAAGRMVLVSDDDGACQVVMQRGTQAAAEAAVMAVLGRLGGTATPLFTASDQGAAAALRLYRVRKAGGVWLVSVGSVGDRYAAGGAAEVRLSCVADPAG